MKHLLTNRKRYVFLGLIAILAGVSYSLTNRPLKMRRLENRSPVLTESKSGNVEIALRKRSDVLSRARLLVEIQNEGDFRKLFSGEISDDRVKTLRFDVPFKEFNVIVHEEKTGIVAIRKINRGSAKLLSIGMDFMYCHDDPVSPLPYITIEDRTTPIGYL